jgi:glutamyl/glutaminyl-tRNA synthetase
MTAESEVKSNFIHTLISKDLAEGKNDGLVHTRFPPEPNGYLHIGHAKAIFLNYTIAKTYNGKFNLRFDDTNPVKEEQEFVDSIIEDIHWLGADWEDRLFFASDYFETKYEFALRLINAGRAYVCDLSPEQIREYRGTLTEPGKKAPIAAALWQKTGTCLRMRKGNSKTVPVCCEPRLIWLPATSICGILCFTEFSTQITTGQGTSGVFTHV